MTIAWAVPDTDGLVLAPDEGVGLLVDPNDRQRRWTVVLRFPLMIPVVAAVAVVGCASGPVLIIAGSSALLTGKVPLWAHRFLDRSATASTRTMAYAMLLHDTWPGLRWTARAQDPVRLVVPPRRSLTRPQRLAVPFRLVLTAPSAVCAAIVMVGWSITAPWAWLATLVIGRAPRSHVYASVAVLRYYLRHHAFSALLTTRYPRHLTGDHGIAPTRARLVLQPAARLLVLVYLAVGSVGYSATIYQAVPVFPAAHSAPDTALRLPVGQVSSPRLWGALAARIPGGLRSFCHPGSGAGSAPVAETTCDLTPMRGAPDRLSYQLFPDHSKMALAYDSLVAELGIAPGADNQFCTQGRPGAGTWDTTTSAGSIGSFACGHRIDSAGKQITTVVWTVSSSNLIGTLEAPSNVSGLADVTSYWASHELTVN